MPYFVHEPWKLERKARWVASFPKSGNTWTRLLLWAYEAPEDFEPNGLPPWYTYDSEPAWWWRVSPIPPEFLTLEEVVSLRGALVAHILRTYPQAVIKTHAINAATERMPMIPVALTERAVYLVRDPRDIVMSMSDHSGIPLDTAIENMGNTQHVSRTERGTLDFLSSWSQHVEGWTNGSASFPVLVLRYEDMLEAPDRAFGPLVEAFFGHCYRKRLINAIYATGFERLKAAEAAGGFVERSKHQVAFFREGRAGQWREGLAPELVARVEREHGVQMRRLGYLPA